ncbi:glycosidase [Arthrobacter sp. H14-L1]|uniref:glycoside hydrolase family 130 protein n=1 Tax=Arthrobacter sp. H14-L1 TaxID=2996697 RepID=UPI00226EB520|nr:glycosidase [Arthrobacter sp. H14-L1]MCY0905848.1 glycosidase [Arthrobacter sp. H14-L1]
MSSSPSALPAVPFTLTRNGVIMVPQEGNDFEAAGVLNPASGWTREGELYLLPRLVAAGNVSRVGLAKVVMNDDGVPASVEREGIVLAPDEGWERGLQNAGIEDPRVTWVPALDRHLMTYVAYGPLGPRLAFAWSEDLRSWHRLGPCFFEYQADLSMDLNLFPNKDAVFFPEPVNDPDGVPSYAMLHRPMWDLGWVRDGEGEHLPAGLTDNRPGIWISYVPVAEVQRDFRNLVHMSKHRLVAMSEFPFEELKIGAGPAPIRVKEGWLLIHHGVSGEMAKSAFALQQKVNYAAAAMILDAHDPSRVIARSAEPLLAPETADEKSGIVPNVVFPTAIEEVAGQLFVFYGMADSKIGVARLDRI